MDTTQQLFFDDYFPLFPTLEDEQIHGSPVDLSSTELLAHDTSSEGHDLSGSEFLQQHPAANSMLLDSVVRSSAANLSNFNQPLFYPPVEPVINQPVKNNSFLSYIPENMTLVNTTATPPVKVFHILENGVIPKESIPVTSQQPGYEDSLTSSNEELLKKKRRKQQRTRHITKDLNAPSSNPVDIFDPEILTGAVLKPSMISPPSLPVVIPDSANFPALKEFPVIPLQKTLPVTSQHELPINFSREELLHLSSDDFEEHIRQVSALRPLTASERNAIKRQRRLIKNRESAQASRQRKKHYVGDLEKKVGDLMSSNAKLKEEYSSLTAENGQLKNEVEFLSDLVGKVKV
jgi:hypothetical protein